MVTQSHQVPAYLVGAFIYYFRILKREYGNKIDIVTILIVDTLVGT